MATKAKSQTANAVAMQFVSVTDIGLQHGRSENQKEACANLALDHIKGFPIEADMSKEDIESLRDGYSLAHKEVYKPVTYAVINGQYFKATPDHIANDKVEKIEATIDWAMVWTPNEMGTEFKDRPELKRIIAEIRKAHSTYISGAYNKLIAKGMELAKKRAGIVTERSVVLFVDSIGKFFDAQAKSVKVKQSKRLDATANPDKFKEAVQAFWTTYGQMPTKKSK